MKGAVIAHDALNEPSNSSKVDIGIGHVVATTVKEGTSEVCREVVAAGNSGNNCNKVLAPFKDPFRFRKNAKNFREGVLMFTGVMVFLVSEVIPLLALREHVEGVLLYPFTELAILREKSGSRNIVKAVTCASGTAPHLFELPSK